MVYTLHVVTGAGAPLEPSQLREHRLVRDQARERLPEHVLVLGGDALRVDVEPDLCPGCLGRRARASGRCDRGCAKEGLPSRQPVGTSSCRAGGAGAADLTGDLHADGHDALGDFARGDLALAVRRLVEGGGRDDRGAVRVLQGREQRGGERGLGRRKRGGECRAEARGTR